MCVGSLFQFIRELSFKEGKYFVQGYIVNFGIFFFILVFLNKDLFQCFVLEKGRRMVVGCLCNRRYFLNCYIFVLRCFVEESILGELGLVLECFLGFRIFGRVRGQLEIGVGCQEVFGVGRLLMFYYFICSFRWYIDSF